MKQCWCGEVHLENPDTPEEAMRYLGHLLLGILRIPELTAWLARKLG